MLKPLDGKTVVLYGGGQFGWSMIDRVMITRLYAYYITGLQDGSGALMAPLVFGTGGMLYAAVYIALFYPVAAQKEVQARIGLS